MKDIIEQSAKAMQKTWSQWEQMVSEFPWMEKSGDSFLRWNNGISAMRLTFETNMNAWKTFMEHNEASFFKMLNDSPFHTETAESQLRNSWDSMKKASETFREIADTQFEKMEELFKKEA